MKKDITIILFILILFTSCDCIENTEGIIYDKETNKPIENAIINFKSGEKNVNSDKNGYFKFSRHSGFCKGIELEITKKGYKPFGLTIKKESEGNIYNIRKEYEYVDLDKPFYPNPNDTSTFLLSISIQKWSQHLFISDTLKFYLSRDERQIEIQNAKNNLIEK